MRYHTSKPEFSELYKRPVHGRSYRCEHPVYSRGTLYFHDGKGLVIIQQRYDPTSRRTWWSGIDPWLIESIYEHDGFSHFFNKNAKAESDGYFPTFTVRQVMWALRMKPLRKEIWETVFDRKPI